MKFACNKIIFLSRINGRKKRGDSGIDLRRGGGSKHPRCAALNENEKGGYNNKAYTSLTDI